MTAVEKSEKASVRMDPLMRLGLDFGPLALFFGSFWIWGILPATGVFMIAFVIAMAISWQIEKRLSPLAIITAAIVIVFGGLTLILQDAFFIKIKPTVSNLTLASILIGAQIVHYPILKMALSHAIQMPDHAWRTLTWRWVGLFLFLAVLNEIVWRNFSEQFWVSFKVWGVFPITMLFTAAQLPFMMKYQLPDPADEAPPKPQP